jgi:large subunit ribosomal protein L13
MAIINAEDIVLGRLASVIAKRLLEGEEIIVVNAERALILGSKSSTIELYDWKREVGSQRKGPFYPKKADRIFKRTVRGMLPYQKPRGREALKRLKVHCGIPKEMKDEAFETPPKKSRTPRTYMRLGEISKNFDPKY